MLPDNHHHLIESQNEACRNTKGPIAAIEDEIPFEKITEIKINPITFLDLLKLKGSPKMRINNQLLNIASSETENA